MASFLGSLPEIT